MSRNPSNFIWYDVMTGDVAAAEKFYADVIGWTIADSGMPDGVYKLLSAGSTMIGGIMPPPEEMGGEVEPGWFGYIWVPDVNEYAERVREAGGDIHRGPMDIPDVGRMAVVSDPHGAAFNLFRPDSDAQPEKVAMGTPGHVGWRDLQSGDLNEAWNFYLSLFGWVKSEAMDMGEMGVYQMFATDPDAGDMAGGMMTKTPDTPKPRWLYYFNVEGIDAAMERVRSGGGEILTGPQEVPGGSWVADCKDPQGAVFGMVAPKR